MRELAAAGAPIRVPVAVACRVLKLHRQHYYAWLAQPVTGGELKEAYLANAVFDAHREDPEFGYRLLFDEVNAAGNKVGERTVWKICSANQWWCVFGKKRRGKNGRPGAPAHDDLVRREVLAAADAGVALERVALVPRAGDDPASVVSALLDGMTYVVVGPEAWLTASERRRLLARARERGSGLVSVNPWEQAAVRLDVTAHRWSGVDQGGGHLRRCELDVARTARGVTDRWALTLPSPASLLIDAVEGQASPAAWRRSALRLVV